MADDNAKLVSYVNQLTEYLEGHFADQKTQIRTMRKLRAQLHEVKIPAEYEATAQIVRTPILPDMLQRVVATLTVNYPTWRRELMGDRPTDETNSSLIEHWLAGGHQRMEIQARRRVFRNLMDSALADGMGVSQILWQPDAWSPFPKRKADESLDVDGGPQKYTARVKKHVREKPFPFAWRDIDPLNYYFWDSYNGKREVILIEDVPLAPAARSLGVKRNGSEKRWEQYTPGQPFPENELSGESVRLVQWWTENQAVYLLDGEHARTVNHKFGRLCIFDFAGLSTHERAPDRAYLPVAFAFAQLIPFLDRLLTMKANWMYLNAFPRTYVKLRQERMDSLHEIHAGLAQEAAQNTRVADLTTSMSKLSALITLYGDEEVGYLIPPSVGGDLDQLIQLTTGLVQQAGIGEVMRGQGMGSDASGYLANQLMTAARLAYDPITDNAKFMLRDQADFLLYGVDKLARTAVPVSGQSLDKGSKTRQLLELSSKEIGGIYETEPNLDPLLPSNYIMEGRFWLEQWEKGGVSKRTYQEKGLHLEDPEEEDYRRLLEDAKEQVKPQMMQKAGEKAGILPKPVPQPAPGLVDQFGQPIPQGGGMDLGNVGMPVTPGMGMPPTPEQVTPGAMPALPGPTPGAPVSGMPGGQFGQQLVTNVGQV